MIRAGRLRLAFVTAALCAACAQPPYVPDELRETPRYDVSYRDAAVAGQPVYSINPRESRIFIRVGRAGAMAAAGHDHVIASEDVEGFVLLDDDPAASRADLRVPLQRLVVDKPDYRRRFGFDTELSESAVNGTTRNMQDRVLESSAFPWADASIRFASVLDDAYTLSISITVHGTAHDYVVPVEIQSDDERLLVAGKMSVSHADFGLTPFSAAGGLLRVAEEIDIEFELVARRVTVDMLDS